MIGIFISFGCGYFHVMFKYEKEKARVWTLGALSLKPVV